MCFSGKRIFSIEQFHLDKIKLISELCALSFNH